MAVRRPPRKNPRGRPPGGSDAIVRGILEATREELQRRGFAELRVERVAAAAGVNKTSIYRRWPTRAELVAAAIAQASEEEPAITPTADLRGDLIALLGQKAANLAHPRARKILQTLMALGDQPSAKLGAQLHAHRYRRPRALLAAAVASGALPPKTDVDFLTELLMAPLLHRILLGQRVDRAFITRVVDHALKSQ
jgi:AcrR family transcriptional regulator